MKRNLKISVIAATLVLFSTFFGSTAKAQVTSGQTVLGVTLTDVVAIVVQPAAALAFLTANDYQNGVSATYPTHITVTCNRPYDLKVKALSDLKAPLGILGGDIGINNISVQIEGTSDVGNTSPVHLSLADQTLTTGAPGTIAKVIGLKYFTAGNNIAFARSAGVFTSNLVYSIAAQ